MPTSLVEWCEAHTDRYKTTIYISEFMNTLSNLSFIFISTLSYNQHPLFLRCNTTLFLVGIGSGIFHATETFWGEIADEMSMSFLMFFYLLISCDILNIQFSRLSYGCIVSLWWSVYIIRRKHDIFVSLFTCQLLLPAYITIFCIKKTPKQKRYLLYALLSMVVGKLCWSYERWLYTNKKCPETWSPIYLLHSYWHIGSAIAHYWIMCCWSDLHLTKQLK